MKKYFVKKEGKAIISRHSSLEDAIAFIKRNYKPQSWGAYLIGCWEEGTPKALISVVGECHGE